MKSFVVRMEDFQHQMVKAAAQKDGVSLNFYVVNRLLGGSPTETPEKPAGIPDIRQDDNGKSVEEPKCDRCKGIRNPDNLQVPLRYEYDTESGESHAICAGCHKEMFGKNHKSVFNRLNAKP